jgi:hypothetical protein
MSSGGSLLKVTIDGVTYRAVGDTDAAKIPNKFENSPLVSSGGNMQKKTLRSQSITGIDLQITPEEETSLAALADRTDNYPMAITWPDETTYRTIGFINIGEYNNQDSKLPCEFHPGFNNSWEPFK